MTTQRRAIDRPIRLKREFDAGKCNCKDGEERCIQAVEVEIPVSKAEVQEARKQEKSSIERRLKLNFQVAQ
eukprot:7784274-Karenia_brevis.AAC.1